MCIAFSMEYEYDRLHGRHGIFVSNLVPVSYISDRSW